jgi:hypothetical protein
VTPSTAEPRSPRVRLTGTASVPSTLVAIPCTTNAGAMTLSLPLVHASEVSGVSVRRSASLQRTPAGGV